MKKLTAFLKINLFLVLFASVFTYIPSAYASQTCKDIISSLIDADFTPFSKRSSEFSRLLKTKHSKGEAEVIEDNLRSLLLIDFEHSTDLLLGMRYFATGLADPQLNRLYQNGRTNRVFLNFKESLSELLKARPQLNLALLKKVHKGLMKNGVDKIKPHELGKFRSTSVSGFIHEDFPIDQAVYNILRENPYLVTTGLRKRGQRYHGEIFYPSSEHLGPYVKDIVRRRDLHLFRELAKKGSARKSENYLNEKLMNVLMEDLMEWFIRKRDSLGAINDIKTSSRKMREFIKLHAEFQRRMISIHPFVDGNGRTSRLFPLYYPMVKEGLPPPRLVQTDSDLFSSLNDWTEQIIRGVYATDRLYGELTYRLQHQMPLELAPELAFPYSPLNYSVSKLRQSPRKLIHNAQKRSLETQEFASYAHARMDADPKLLNLYDENPYQFFLRMEEDFLAFLKRGRLIYHHKKEGVENLALRFANDDFLTASPIKVLKIPEDGSIKWSFFMTRRP